LIDVVRINFIFQVRERYRSRLSRAVTTLKITVALLFSDLNLKRYLSIPFSLGAFSIVE
jgi:hypothetical protein